MLRLIVKHNSTFKTYDFKCADLEKDVRQYRQKLVGIEVFKGEREGVVISVPAGATPRLLDCGDRVIPVIKAIRQHTGWGLRESKDLADSAPVDLPIMDAETAALLIADLREAGATVAIPIGNEDAKG